MAYEFNVFNGAFSAIDMAMEQVVNLTYNSLVDQAQGALITGFLLYITIQGYSVIRGQTQGTTLPELGWQIAKLMIIYTLITKWGTFYEVVYKTVLGVYSGLGNTISDALSAAPHLDSGLGTMNTKSLDEAFSAQLTEAAELVFGWPTTFDVLIPISIPGIGGPSFDIPVPVPNLINNMMGIFMLVMTVILFASVFIVMLLSRIGLVSCLAVAPIFISLMMFEQTKSYTDAWLRGLVGFALTPALLVLILVIADMTRSLATVPHYGSGKAADIVGQFVAYLIFQYGLAKAVSSVPQFASGLVGSMLSNLGGGAAEGLIGRLHAPVKGAIGAAKGAASGMATGGPVGAKMGAVKGAVSTAAR